MTFQSWTHLESHIVVKVGPPSADQVRTAAALNVDIEGVPSLVAAARIRGALSPVLLEASRPPTDAQLEHLEGLTEQEGGSAPPVSTAPEASAWIEVLWLQRRIALHRALQLTSGDLILVARPWESQIEEVSSLGPDGRIWLRGGQGKGAWPDQVSVAYRTTDASPDAQKARAKIANKLAAARPASQLAEWFVEEKEPFRIQGAVTAVVLGELRSVIDDATDEAPIQRFVAKHPEVLSAAVSGEHAKYVLPGVALGSQYVADFMVVGVDSRGMRWVLVELESPRGQVALKTGNSLARAARTGVAQIQEWREWLHGNLDYAQKPRAENGLGLKGIRAQSPGLVLVGRRNELTAAASPIRQRLSEENSIEVHTYDWLIDRLAQAIDGKGLDLDRV